MGTPGWDGGVISRSCDSFNHERVGKSVRTRGGEASQEGYSPSTSLSPFSTCLMNLRETCPARVVR